MLWTTWAIFVFVSLIVAYQSVLVLALACKLVRYRRQPLDEEALPTASIVLCVRGPDPCLADTLRDLIDQEYPRFKIHLVLDSETDDALGVLTSVVEERKAENVEIAFLQEPRPSCSLKCSALIEAIGDVESECEAVAFIDGDARPHRTWLRELVEPLADPSVGVTGGNRWYMPANAEWGTLVRFIWNTGAVVHMWMTGFAWAGSMALRTDVIRKIGLPEAWSRALSVDATVCREIHRNGYRARFVPSVLLVNDESISLPRFVAWVQRQLIAGKSSGHGWWIVVLHAMTLILSQVVPLGFAIWAGLLGNALAALVSVAALILFWLDGLLLALILDRAARRALQGTGRSRRWLCPATICRMLPAIVLTYVAYPYAVARAAFLRRVSWRGVEYELRGTRDVRLLQYRPYSQDANASSEKADSVI